MDKATRDQLAAFSRSLSNHPAGRKLDDAAGRKREIRDRFESDGIIQVADFDPRSHLSIVRPDGEAAQRRNEYRAVFTTPGGVVSYGPPRLAPEAAALDTPPRAEETLAYRSGIQIREVTPWGDDDRLA